MNLDKTKNIDVKIMKKGDDIASYSLSSPIGKDEDGDIIQHVMNVKSLQDVVSSIIEKSRVATDFPNGNVVFNLDGKPLIDFRDGVFKDEFKVDDETYDKYSNEKRTKINMEFDKDRNVVTFDKDLGFYYDEKDKIVELHGVDSLTELYNTLYDNLQGNTNFPSKADFYIDNELFASVDRMHNHHLSVEDLSPSVVIDHGKVFVLHIETVNNENGTISLENKAPEILYKSEMCNGLIKDKNGSTEFPSKKEALSSLDDYMKGKNGQYNRHIKDLDMTNLILDGEKIGTYGLDRCLFKDKDLIEKTSKVKLKNK